MDRLWYIVIALAAVYFILIVYCGFFILWRRRQQKKQHHENARLETILRTGDMVLWTYNTETLRFVRFATLSMERMDLSMDDIKKMLSEEDFGSLMSVIGKVQSGAEKEKSFVFTPVLTIDPKDRGHESEMSVSVLAYDGTRPVMLMGLQHDITRERKQRRHDEITMKRYHALFEESMFDIALFDNKGRLVDINAHGRKTFHIDDLSSFIERGYGIKDIPQFSDIDFNDIESHNMTTAFTIDTRKFSASSVRGRIVGGDNGGGLRKMYYESSVVPIYNDDGGLENICVRARDVTDIAAGYHTAQRDSRRLMEYTRRIADISSMVSYVMKTIDAVIVSYFPDERRFVFYKDMGQPYETHDEIEMFSMFDPDSYHTIINTLLLLNRRVDRPVKITLHSRGEGGKGIGQPERWLSLNLVPVHKKGGAAVDAPDVNYYFGSLQNDTQIITTTQRLRQEKTKAEEAEGIKSAFLKNMSYEVRTPLNAVLGFADLLSHSDGSDDDRVFVEQIKLATVKLLNLVNDVLLLSQLDAGMLEKKVSSVDVTEMFNNKCRELWQKYGDSGKEFIIDDPYVQLTAAIDQHLVGEVLDRLISNAARFTSSGQVLCRCEYVGGSITFTVEDTGRGMSGEQIVGALKRFSKSEDDNGTGLGLPICQSIVKLLGGRFGISSKVGEGTHVWFSLPAVVSAMKRKKVVYM